MTGVTDVIRVCDASELERLQVIEESAGRCFVRVGMAEIAEDEPPAVEELERYRKDGRLLVTGKPAVAYLMWDLVDGAAHVEQVSVHADAARRGLGRALIDRVQVGSGLAVTLTTFRDVAWNAPYYERIGFRVLSPDEVTPGLARVRAREVAHGLDRWPRVCMRRDEVRSH
jgi:ribosomal protein S18 acetylase RimI-like enzyme